VGKIVDRNFRLIGIDALRVVDGSVFTLLPGTNPQTTLLMLATVSRGYTTADYAY
jgi:choline dehydrogenase-like flavoprotein